MELLISLIGGTIGSNAAGKILRSFDQGNMYNSIIGVIGGVIGIQILAIVTAGNMDINNTRGIGMLCLVLSGTAAGGLLLPTIGIIKNIITK